MSMNSKCELPPIPYNKIIQELIYNTVENMQPFCKTHHLWDSIQIKVSDSELFLKLLHIVFDSGWSVS